MTKGLFNFRITAEKLTIYDHCKVAFMKVEAPSKDIGKDIVVERARKIFKGRKFQVRSCH